MQFFSAVRDSDQDCILHFVIMSPLILINPSAFPSFMTMTFLENTSPCLNRLHRKNFLRNVGFMVVIIVLQLTIFVSEEGGEEK